jgi:hypothetical protein
LRLPVQRLLARRERPAPPGAGEGGGVGLLGTASLIAGPDLLTWKKRGVETTITDVTRPYGRVLRPFAYVLAFAMACLLGHFFL